MQMFSGAVVFKWSEIELRIWLQLC